MSVKRIIGILISVALDILTFIFGITGVFISMIGGNFIAAGIVFLIMIFLMVGIPLLTKAITRDKTVEIPDKSANYVNSKVVGEDDHLSLKEIKRIVSRYQYGFYLGKIAKDIINQANLVGVKITEAKEAVSNRFEVNSITWDRYMGVVDSAADTAVNNLDMMARRLSVLDEKEYASLANPFKRISGRTDNTGRLEFYQENKQSIEKGICENEEVFNKLDKLALELRKSAEDSAGSDAVINDIEEMTDQIKYYNK